MKPTALFLSPHLDDVAFSIGATLIGLARHGWRTVLATAFTASVPNPSGFALACQTDKGLGPEVDYMALRRAEDEVFAERAGVDELCWLAHPEAPHRGYDSPAALFGPPRDDDDAVVAGLAADLRRLLARLDPGRVFAPQAVGGHVDHRQLVRAALEAARTLCRGDRVCWYRDLPYGLRDPSAAPPLPLPSGLAEQTIDISATASAKVAACAAYRSQLGFQFNGPTGLAILADPPVERLLAPPCEESAGLP
ncbi:MAG: PIG-L deacetylase family protein [Egibacteraceae bacterium]